MVKIQRTSEGGDFDFNEEDDDFNDEELDDAGGKDEEFSLEALTPKERKRYEKMRQDVEEAVVEAIAKGDTTSGVYKGLQKVLSKRDRELEETRNILAQVVQRVSTDTTSSDVEFLKSILEEMLDDESKPVYNARLQSHLSKREQDTQKAMLEQLLQQQQAQRFDAPRYGTEEQDAKIAQYQKEATEKLKNFAKKTGIDPTTPGLDYGDESEPLLHRMDKLASSIEKIQEKLDDDEISHVRKKGDRPQTRTDRTSRGGQALTGADLLARGSAKMIEQFRKM